MSGLRSVLTALAVFAPMVVMAQVPANDSLFASVQRLVNEGNRAAARAMADSALDVRTAGTMAHAEALFARAYATLDASAAERDYLRVAVEYPFSRRADEASFQVAQFRTARGDRPGARRRYELLAREHPMSPLAPRAGYWAGRLALEDGDVAQGCASLAQAMTRVEQEEVELRNQIDYYLRRCPKGALTVPRQAEQPSAEPRPRGLPPEAPGPVSGAAPTAAGGWSVQVAAYQRKADADRAASRLRARGFQVRVVGTRAPYRVRVGRYATRADAVAAQGRMRRQSRVNGVVVAAEPR